MTCPSGDTEPLHWCGLPARVDGLGVVHVDTGRGGARIWLELAAPWGRDGALVVDIDTVEQHWRASGARARTRLVLGDVCHLDVWQEFDVDAELPPPVLVVETDEDTPPAWLFPAWNLGRAGLAVDAGVLHFRQVSGASALWFAPDMPVDEHCIGMLPARATAGVRRARWRCDLVGSWRDIARQLPAWLPHCDVLDVAERLVIPLADAAVAVDDAMCEVVGDTTEVVVAPGQQLVQVSDRAGTVSFYVAGAPGVHDHLVGRAREVLGLIDPRQVTGTQLWLVLHARAELDAESFLAAGAEEVAARVSRERIPDPFAVATLAAWAGSDGSEDMAKAAGGAVDRWARLDPALIPWGARLATSWVQVTAHSLGLEKPRMLPRPRPGSLVELEHALVTMDRPLAQRSVERWSDALAAGLPFATARTWDSCVAAALIRLLPSNWQRAQDADALAVWERRLVIFDDEREAWLHW